MKLLSLDTATDACSCALYIDGQIYERSIMAARRHAELLLPMIDELCQQVDLIPSQLNAVIFGRGPGSFTGLRIACSVAQGIAFAAQVPVIPVSSLAAMAQFAYQELKAQLILTALDARMNEVYWGCYRGGNDGLVTLKGKEMVCSPNKVPLLTEGQWYGVGNGWTSYATILRERLEPCLQTYDDTIYPHASYLLPLAIRAIANGQMLPPEQALPVYLRDQVVQVVR